MLCKAKDTLKLTITIYDKITVAQYSTTKIFGWVGGLQQ